jgi:hypothetical protein
MADIEIYYPYGGDDYLLPFDTTQDVGWRNLGGNMIESISLATDEINIPIPGVYRLSHTNSAIGGYWTAVSNCNESHRRFTTDWDNCMIAAATSDVLVTCDDDDNPLLNYRSEFTVDISADNDNRRVLPGLNIKFVQCPIEGQLSEIVVGGAWVSSEGRVITPTVFGKIPTGTNSGTKTFKIKNSSGVTLENIKVTTINKTIVMLANEATASPFKSIRQMEPFDPVGFTSSSTVDITLSDYDPTDSTISLLVDSTEHDITDTTDGSTMIDGKKLKCDGTTEYMFPAGSQYSGLAFILSSSPTIGTVAAMLTSPGGDLWRIKKSTDSSWTRGSKGISLDNIIDGGSTNIDVQCSPRLGAETNMGAIQSLLFVDSDTATGYITLLAEPKSGGLQILAIRSTVIPQAVYDKMEEFGVTVS